MSGITLSKKYGVNPSLQICPICGKDMGIIMFGNSYKDKNGNRTEAPRQVAIPGHICDSCKDVIENKHGIFFIEVKDGESKKNTKDPYRTGRVIAIAEAAVQRMGITDYQPVNYVEETDFTRLFGEALSKHNQ